MSGWDWGVVGGGILMRDETWRSGVWWCKEK